MINAAYSRGTNNITAGLGNNYISLYNSFDNNTINGGIGDDVISIYSSRGNNTIEAGDGNDSIDARFARGDNLLTGGIGDDTIQLWRTSGINTLNYSNDDGTDSVSAFRGGIGGDILSFTDIPNIDLVSVGKVTEIRLGDGIADNTGFGTGYLLITLNSTPTANLTADNFQNTAFFLS